MYNSMLHSSIDGPCAGIYLYRKYLRNASCRFMAGAGVFLSRLIYLFFAAQIDGAAGRLFYTC